MKLGVVPLAGPVSVGAAIIPPDFSHPVINDSKKLTEKKREALYDELSENPDIKWSVCLVEAKEVDEVNVLRATSFGDGTCGEGARGKSWDVPDRRPSCSEFPFSS